MSIEISSISEVFYKAVDYFIDCTRTNKNIYIVIILLFCLFLMNTVFCIIYYYKRRHDSNIRIKMISYGILFLLCFCIFMINLLFTWQIAIPATLITVLLINKEKNICYDLEVKKQISDNILNDKNAVYIPFYTNLYSLFIISIVICIICYILIQFSGVWFVWKK